MRIAATAMLAVSLMGAGLAPSANAKSTYKAEITRTTYNIPHIVAKDWRGLGYGIAYAYAQDNICMLAEEFATVAGTRSLHWGPETKTQLGFSESDNLASDIFHLSQIDTQALRAGWAQQSEEGRAVFDGYVAGYNRYLRDAKKRKVRLPEACAGKAWVKPIKLDDLLRLTEKTMMRASSLALGAGIAGAAPPNMPQPTAPRVALPDAQDRPLGSNGWAFGSEVTADGKGLLIGNPHFPWNGPARFWQMHATIPGTYDVMGVGLAGTPLPTLGFNKDVAWTHTVTEARHMTLYALTLAEGDPTSYMVDGEPVKMTSKTVTVPMPEGMEPVTRTLYFTRFGPVVTIPDFSVGWTKTIAVALKDANRLNQRGIDTWMRIGLAKNVGDIEAAVSETLGIPWVNTIAADREGNALHADITAVPNVSTQMAQDCSTPMSGLFAARVTLLDGTRSECDWGDTLLPASDQASRTRTDYVTNSNDSYWISNPSDPYRALSPILGAYEKPLSLRTRSNFIETEALLSKGKVDHARAKELVYGNKSLAADMVVDGVLALCEGSNSLAEACSALSGWDREFELESRGGYLFITFWRKVMNRPDLWDVAFDPGAPISTPRTLSKSAALTEALTKALTEAAAELAEQGVALDAPWSEVMTQRLVDGTRIPVHGGPGWAGVLNMQQGDKAEGGLKPRHGSSYIQIVSFGEEGPQADAILSYSQSTDPNSEHFSDQTRLYSAKEWHRLPFTAEEIADQQVGKTIKLRERR